MSTVEWWAIAQEYIHLLQDYRHPVWLTEGFAQYATRGYEPTGIERSLHRMTKHYNTYSCPGYYVPTQLYPQEATDVLRQDSSNYRIGELAVVFMVEHVEVSEVAVVSHRQTDPFGESFGMTLEEFYDAFAAWAESGGLSDEEERRAAVSETTSLSCSMRARDLRSGRR